MAGVKRNISLRPSRSSYFTRITTLTSQARQQKKQHYSVSSSRASRTHFRLATQKSMQKRCIILNTQLRLYETRVHVALSPQWTSLLSSAVRLFSLPAHPQPRVIHRCPHSTSFNMILRQFLFPHCTPHESRSPTCVFTLVLPLWSFLSSRMDQELLLNPLIIARNENERVLIEGSINSVRVSIKIKQSDEMEKVLVDRFSRFLMQRAEEFNIMRRSPVQVCTSDT